MFVSAAGPTKKSISMYCGLKFCFLGCLEETGMSKMFL